MAQQATFSAGVASRIAGFLPFLDLRGYRPSDLRYDLLSGLAVTFLSVPQGVAYAIIAGLPPVMGLYAAALPAVVGSLLRSSRHVISGPTNALSLLVGAVLASQTGLDPVAAAVSLAMLVGLFQVAAGALKLGALSDYISRPVILGYITGAAVLIGVGQLRNITGTDGASGNLWQMLSGWASGLSATEPLAVVVAALTLLLVVGLRRLDKRIPGYVIAMALAIAASALFGLDAHGVALISGRGVIPTSLPELHLPDLRGSSVLLSAAVACTVLSIVESSAVARAIASRTGQRLDMSAEFFGQGAANLASGLVGGYPVSGSLSRSALNEQAGARSRLSGVISGVLVLGVVMFLGPIVDLTPVAALAGLIVVLAIELVDLPRIRQVMRAAKSDRVAFVITLLGTWVLPLDIAIYLGIGVSLVSFLRRARMLVVRELVVDENGRLTEVAEPDVVPRRCPAVRVINVEGPLFFGAAGEFQSALDIHLADREAKVVILRMKRTQGLDVTTAAVLEDAARRLAGQGRTLLVVGLREVRVRLLAKTGMLKTIGEENVFPTQPGWFVAMEAAIRRALMLAQVTDSPFEKYISAFEKDQRAGGGTINAEVGAHATRAENNSAEQK